MLRIAEKHIALWFKRQNRKPLVIRGARQVGKSTLVSNFASKNQIQLHEVNLEINRNLKPAFESMDINRIIKELEFSLKTKIQPGEILFLDEIQAIPSAISALRYFYEKRPELAVIAAGSLLEVILSSENYSMPVGRTEYFYLGPMTFNEFLLASNNQDLQELLNSFNVEDNFPITAHDRLENLLKNFLLIGGMPEAVATFINTTDIASAQRVHRSIVNNYRDDFSKYASGPTLARLQIVFDKLASQLGRKIKYSNIDPNIKSRDIKTALNLLTMAQVVTKTHHSSASQIPLRSQINTEIYKTYFVDCGLSATALGIDRISQQDVDDSSFFSNGSLIEQFIQQHLHYLQGPEYTPELFYWLREGRSNKAEVDFLLQHHTKIVPIEVKAGSSGTLKSLIQFLGEKETDIALRFDLGVPSIMDINQKIIVKKTSKEVSGKIISLPSYAVEQTHRLLEHQRNIAKD